MSIGIELIFSRDLICKFTQDKDIEDEAESHTRQWQMIGLFDFLSIAPINGLEDVGTFEGGRQWTPATPEQRSPSGGGPSDQSRRRTVSIGAHSGLVLIPFEDELQMDPPDSAAAGERTVLRSGRKSTVGPFEANVITPDLGSDDDSEAATKEEQAAEIARRNAYPLLVGVKFSLSVIAYELEKLYTGVLHSTEALRRIINKAIQTNRQQEDPKADQVPRQIKLYRTLSNPDLVLLALPQDAIELRALDRMIQRLRTLELETLRQELQTMKEEGLTSGGSALPGGNREKDSNWDFQHPNPPLRGHALADVAEFLAFRQNSGQELNAFNFDGGDKPSVKLRLDYRLCLDCGHDAWIKKTLANALNGLKPPAARETIEALQKLNWHSFGRHTLSGVLYRIDDFVNLWNIVWYCYKLRAANLIDSHTTISFPDDLPMAALPVPREGTMIDPTLELAWCIAEWPNAEIGFIIENLTWWAERYLSSTQQQEFLNSVGTFRSCFLHHELASAARDLTPFLRQLSFACSPKNQQLWDDFRSNSDPEKFSDEVSELIVHLHLAVRNRLEHRSGQADPTLPHTLVHGASKLIGAYSAVSWFSGELFAKWKHVRRDKQEDEYCHADELAVCVAAGNQGRVIFNILFEDFRRFVERREGKRLAEATPGDWSARLLLLEISGRSLFRPEACLLHCLQETVQYSEWYLSDRVMTLRSRLNAWILAEYRLILMGMLRTPVPGEKPEDYPACAIEIYRYLYALLAHIVQKAARTRSAQDLAHQQYRSFKSLDGYEPLKYFGDILAKMSPLDFVRLVTEAIEEYLPQVEVWRELPGFRKEFQEKYGIDPCKGLVSRLPLWTARLIETLNGAPAAPTLEQITRTREPSREGGRHSGGVPGEPFRVRAKNLVDLVVEVASDIGMWCALDHLVSHASKQDAATEAKIRTVQDRLRDVHLVFSSLMKLARERAGHYFTEAEFRLMILRWTIHAVAVSDVKVGIESLLNWFELNPGLRANGASEESLPEFLQWKKVKERIESFPEFYSGIFKPEPGHLISSLNPKALEPGDHRRPRTAFVFYQDPATLNADESLEDLGLPLPTDLGAAGQMLWTNFNETWNLVRKRSQLHAEIQAATESERGTLENLQSKNDHKLSASQIKFVTELWAKSVRLRYHQAFEPSKPTQEEKDAKPGDAKQS